MSNPFTSNVQHVAQRMAELGLWDSNERRPVFGWIPIIYGYQIDLRLLPAISCSSPIGYETPVVFINGVHWPSIGITISSPQHPTCPYAEGFRKLQKLREQSRKRAASEG